MRRRFVAGSGGTPTLGGAQGHSEYPRFMDDDRLIHAPDEVVVSWCGHVVDRGVGDRLAESVLGREGLEQLVLARKVTAPGGVDPPGAARGLVHGVPAGQRPF